MAYESRYQEKIDEGLKKLASAGKYTYNTEKPDYSNAYSEQQTRLLNSLTNTPSFSYTVESDPAYQAYKKQYLREGQRAAQNAIGQAAAANGGAVSTAGMTAAVQAGQNYAAQLSDMVPTLYNQAYERYQDEYNRNLQNLSAVNNQEQLEYARYRDAVGDWQNDRSFDYSTYLDDYDRAGNTLAAYQNADATEYARYQDALSNALSLWSQYGYATQPVADALGVPVGTPTSDQSYREWSRKIQEQELENDAANTKWNQALSLLQELGYAPEQVASVLGVGTGTKTADYTQQAVENAMNWAKINAGSSASGGSSGSGSADGTAAATTATTAAANAGTAAASSAGTSGSGNGSSAASASGTGGTIPSAFLTMASEIRKKVDGGDYTGAENDAYNILSSQNNTMNDAQIRNFCKVAGVSYDNIVSRVARS